MAVAWRDHAAAVSFAAAAGRQKWALSGLWLGGVKVRPPRPCRRHRCGLPAGRCGSARRRRERPKGPPWAAR
jgi:hypothetical protein